MLELNRYEMSLSQEGDDRYEDLEGEGVKG